MGVLFVLQNNLPSLSYYMREAVLWKPRVCESLPGIWFDFQGDQGDREGRPYNTRWRGKRASWYCTGDPRGRPGRLSCYWPRVSGRL